jgi:hypothetical protein
MLRGMGDNMRCVGRGGVEKGFAGLYNYTPKLPQPKPVRYFPVSAELDHYPLISSVA